MESLWERLQSREDTTGSHEFFNPWMNDPIPSSALAKDRLISLASVKSALSREKRNCDVDVGSVRDEKAAGGSRTRPGFSGVEGTLAALDTSGRSVTGGMMGVEGMVRRGVSSSSPSKQQQQKYFFFFAGTSSFSSFTGSGAAIRGEFCSGATVSSFASSFFSG